MYDDFSYPPIPASYGYNAMRKEVANAVPPQRCVDKEMYENLLKSFDANDACEQNNSATENSAITKG